MAIEILAPAGSFQSLEPAVRCGADAVYFGAHSFSARAGAANFSLDEIASAVEYCRIRGVKTYLAVNTLLRDTEVNGALELIGQAWERGVDAFIIQEPGLAFRLKENYPFIPIHASTQLSVHTLSGVREAAAMGFSRVVLAREMSRREIAEIARESPVELEVFVHGALCMSVSGQCYLSAMLGGRSGNRGDCAQPCRLPFGIPGMDTVTHALSLKDLSVLGYIKELQEMGVASAKIEGRMKRPEYVAAAVTAYRLARDEGKIPAELLENLRAVFSRSGFTDGYYAGRRGKEMFGIRTKEDVTNTAVALRTLRGLYQNERQNVVLSGSFIAKIDTPMCLTLTDPDGSSVSVMGETPDPAHNKETLTEDMRRQLCKTGGTPYRIDALEMDCDPGLAIPLSRINQLRRDGLDKMSDVRCRVLGNRCQVAAGSHNFEVGRRGENCQSGSLRRRAFCLNPGIVSEAFRAFDIVFLPMETKLSEFMHVQDIGIIVGADIPRGIFGQEQQVAERLEELRAANITHLRVSNLGALQIARDMDCFELHGGFGLNIMNVYSLEWGKLSGLKDMELSIEAPLHDEIDASIELGIVSYGYLPLMLLRNAPVKNGRLIDRKGNSFHVRSRYGCAELFNPVPLWLADKHLPDCLGFQMFYFTNETPEQAREIISAYQKKEAAKSSFTRGLNIV